MPGCLAHDRGHQVLRLEREGGLDDRTCSIGSVAKWFVDTKLVRSVSAHKPAPGAT